MIVLGLTIFLVLFFIKNGNKATNQESEGKKEKDENKKGKEIEKEKEKKRDWKWRGKRGRKGKRRRNIGHGQNELCLTCEKENYGSCNPGYKLKDGKCIFIYSFKATYESTKTHQYTSIFGYSFSKKIINVQMNEKNYNNLNYFNFPDEGKYELFALVDASNLTSLKFAFSMMSELISISFTEEYNTDNKTNMDNMFGGASNLKEVNMSYLNVDNVKNMDGMFSNFKKLNSVNLSNLKTTI